MKSSILKNAFLGLVVVVAGIGGSATSALAQVEQPSRISIQGTGLVTRSFKDELPSYDATKSGGLLVGYSYQFTRLFGAEGNYGYTRNTQKFNTTGGPSSVESDFHEITGALVVHIPAGDQRVVEPYALGGGGAVVFDPTDRFIGTGAERQTRGAFIYGGGANFRVTKNFAIRTEYRGLFYKVPDFEVDTLNLDKFTHLAQPSVGFVFRF